MADALPLSISDAESAYKAISDLVISYPNYPKSFTADATTVRWNGSEKDVSIGLFPMQGAIYIKQYISGSYVAQLPFEISFKTSPTTNKANISAQDMLTDLGRWLEKCAISFKDSTNIEMESMKRTSPVYITDKNEKTTEFSIQMQLKYSFKK